MSGVGRGMNIDIVLKTERGEVVAACEALLLVGPQFARLRERVPVLNQVHVAALTMFNVLQRAALAEQVAGAGLGRPEDDQVLREVARLCELSRDETHLYLWFLGA